MGRTEPTVVKPPAAFRRDARAKRARATIHKVIPMILSAHPRAQQGIENSELILDPAPLDRHVTESQPRGTKTVEHGNGNPSTSNDKRDARRVAGSKKGGRRRKSDEPDPDEKQNSLPVRLKVVGGTKDVKDSDQSTTTPNRGAACEGGHPRITLCVADTLEAAHALLCSENRQQKQQHHGNNRDEAAAQNGPEATIAATVTTPMSGGDSKKKTKQRHRIGILNMASPLSPGGGFLNGATSQEESLCMRTTLLPALRDEFYRLPELGVVYTPDVLVFRSSLSSPLPLSNSVKGINDGSEDGIEWEKRKENESSVDDILAKSDRWFVDVVTAAMLRMPETDTDDEDNNGNEDAAGDGVSDEDVNKKGHGQSRRYTDPANRELAERKMRAVMRVFAAHGCTRVVLGAWGCGAYGNPITEIARAWRRVLLPSNGADGVRNHHHHPRREQQQPSPRGNENENKNERVRDKDSRSNRNKQKDKKFQSEIATGGTNGNRNGKGETWGTYIEDVVFVIKDPSMAAAFSRAFGEHLISPSSSSKDGEVAKKSSLNEGDGEEDPIEAARVRELRDKIAQLEVQIEQARSQHLKTGLGTVLASLRAQLPTTSEIEEAGEHDEGLSSDSGREEEDSEGEGSDGGGPI